MLFSDQEQKNWVAKKHCEFFDLYRVKHEVVNIIDSQNRIIQRLFNNVVGMTKLLIKLTV